MTAATLKNPSYDKLMEKVEKLRTRLRADSNYIRGKEIQNELITYKRKLLSLQLSSRDIRIFTKIRAKSLKKVKYNTKRSKRLIQRRDQEMKILKEELFGQKSKFNKLQAETKKIEFNLLQHKDKIASLMSAIKERADKDNKMFDTKTARSIL